MVLPLLPILKYGTEVPFALITIAIFSLVQLFNCLKYYFSLPNVFIFFDKYIKGYMFTNLINKSRSMSTEKFIEKATNTHGDRYDYSYSVYTNCSTKIKIICNEHGEFSQNYLDHINGSKCNECAKISRSNKKRKPIEKFIQQANIVHNFKYTYENVEYKNSKHKISITCAEHGDFLQLAGDHLIGHGCKKCGIEDSKELRKMPQEEFIRQAVEIHGDKYDYSYVNYINTMTPVAILCKKHNSIFNQRPNSHVSKSAGCPKCSSRSYKKERAWLAYLNVPDTDINRQIKAYINGNLYRFDGYIPETNTVYEFWGDVWHGNPEIHNPDERNKLNGKLFGDLYKHTLFKRQEIIEAGYNLIEIWEKEWDMLLLENKNA